MNKALAIVATTVLAASASTLAATSDAHANDRFWSGIKPSFSSPSRSYQAPSYHRPRREIHVVQPRATQPSAPTQKAEAAPRIADGKGREFDAASKVWFDGKDRCFSGQQAFTFKAGSWFYGTSKWYEADGSWQTDAAVAPIAVNCGSAPVFAARVKPAAPQPGSPSKDTQYSESRGNASGGTAQPEVPPTKMAEIPAEPPAKGAPRTDFAPAKSPECKKYFPSVGGMMNVPCEQ